MRYVRSHPLKNNIGKSDSGVGGQNVGASREFSFPSFPPLLSPRMSHNGHRDRFNRFTVFYFKHRSTRCFTTNLHRARSANYSPSLPNMIPSYNESPSTSATTKFPPAMNGYFQWKLTTTFHLGPTAEEKLYAVSTPATVSNNKPTVVLHDGPTNKR